MSQECDEIVRLISEYVDGELPLGTCARIGEHLDSCGRCHGLHESLRSTVDACREFQSGETPGPMAPHVQEELRTAFRKAVAARRVTRSTAES
jgi:anti-sigma factor RsiW